MTVSDNPIGASYLYLLEPEIRFLEAAVEHLIPTGVTALRHAHVR